MDPSKAQSFRQIPGVVDGLVVVEVVVLEVVVAAVVVSLSTLESLVAASFAACSTFSMDMGLGEGDGQPANSVVALEKLK